MQTFDVRTVDALPFAGFEEVEHTADWAYRVWAADLATLFIQAAIALYALAGVVLAREPLVEREVQLQGVDSESLLVAWLNELLYFRESENLGFNQFQILHLTPQDLKIQMGGAAVTQWSKYVKAVTYHNLSIRKTATGYEATLVLDV